MYHQPPYWFRPDESNMTPKDWIEAWQAMDKIIADKTKPKEEKKPDKPKWDTVDYFAMFLCIFTVAISADAYILLHELTSFMKAVPH